MGNAIQKGRQVIVAVVHQEPSLRHCSGCPQYLAGQSIVLHYPSLVHHDSTLFQLMDAWVKKNSITTGTTTTKLSSVEVMDSSISGIWIVTVSSTILVKRTKWPPHSTQMVSRFLWSEKFIEWTKNADHPALWLRVADWWWMLTSLITIDDKKIIHQPPRRQVFVNAVNIVHRNP